MYFDSAASATAHLLERYNVSAELTDGDVMVASLDLDSLAPFKGEKTNPDQVRQFPRDGAADVPPEVLDWVALRALHVRDDEPVVTSVKVDDITYQYQPTPDPRTAMLRGLVEPYLLKRGRVW